jgi:spore coat polysaccharide biosynthesis protein SpsF (cytidylyltransferase family)
MNRIGTVVSARTASKRLPAKALLDLGGMPMIRFLLERLRTTRHGGPVIFATTQRGDDDELAEVVRAGGFPVFRGADADVAGRYLACAQEFELDWIVRVTGDCPFVDAESMDACLLQWSPADDVDMVSTKGVFPVGIDYELFSSALLAAEWPRMSGDEREHLTLRFYRADLGFRVQRFTKPASWPAVGHTFLVDTPADYERAVRTVSRFENGRFGIGDLLGLRD